MTHLEHIASRKYPLSRDCTRHDVNFGGECFNCGWDPKLRGISYTIKKLRLSEDPSTFEVTLEENDTPVGWVFRTRIGQWSAVDTKGNNHGDHYLDMWGAAQQLQLGTGIGVIKGAID